MTFFSYLMMEGFQIASLGKNAYLMDLCRLLSAERIFRLDFDGECNHRSP
jgi:hypothetical protein